MRNNHCRIMTRTKRKEEEEESEMTVV